MNTPLRKCLVVRNDKLGDFMLSYPSFALLKQANANIRIYALVPKYTREMAEACAWIDEVIIDPGANAPWKEQWQLLTTIRSLGFNAAITLFSTTRIGWLLFFASIPHRFAPATKLAQIFYNFRLTQRRSRSEKPEYEYNTDLARYYLKTLGIELPQLPVPPFLRFETSQIKRLKQGFYAEQNIKQGTELVFIHPGSGGSANNLSLEQYADLANALTSSQPVAIVVTAGPNEHTIAMQLAKKIKTHSVSILHSTKGLQEFAQHIQFADVFISGSTGPLHIAGALDTPTAAFYTRRRSATSLRWQTLNSANKRLAFAPPLSADECDMSAVDITQAAQQISDAFL